MARLALLTLVLVPLLVPSGASAKRSRPHCAKGKTSIRQRGHRPRCVKTRKLLRGVGASPSAVVTGLADGGRERGRGSIATALGADAKGVAAWERRLITAGQKALAGRRTRAEDLGLTVAGPLQWIADAKAVIETVSGDDVFTGKGRVEGTKGTLVKKDGTASLTYEVVETGEPWVVCPSEGGTVVAEGTLVITATLVRGGKPVTEKVFATWTVTGRVGEDARLKSYTVEVTTDSDRGAGKAIAVDLPARGSAAETAIIGGKDVVVDGTLDPRVAMVALRYGQEKGLAKIQESESHFYEGAECVRIVSTPEHVEPGVTKEVEVKVISNATGKVIESGILGIPSGGAKITPTKGKSTPGRPAKFRVTMPKKTKRALRAGGGGVVSIDARSRQGRGLGSIGSDDVPAYDVTLGVTGQGRFATHDADGTLMASWQAVRQAGDAKTWAGSVPAAWAPMTARSKSDCAYSEPRSAGSVGATLTENADGTITVAFDTDGVNGTFTTTCPTPDGPPAVVEGVPGLTLVGFGPASFTLPAAGGTQPMTSNVSDGGEGFFDAGSLTVTPVVP